MDSANLTARGVLAVAVTWVDTSGITRVKAVPVPLLPRAVEHGVGASPVFDYFLLDDSIVGGGPVGDLRLKPDVERLTVLSAQPGWAWAPGVRYTQEGAVHPADARGLAIRTVDKLKEQGLTVMAAFEVEWCVSEGQGDEFVPACKGPAYGMTRITEQAQYLHDLLHALSDQGVDVEQIHPEYAAGQYELSVSAQNPVRAADTLILVRETIRAVSHNHGLRATFAPKVVAGGVGNGGHVHLSVWRGSKSLFAGGDGPYEMTADGMAFIGGMLSRLPALLAVGAPSVGSYLRLIPSTWAGPWACWGLENREAAVRFITAGSPNVEVKCFDGSANPYLALAGLMMAGAAGIAEGARLPDPVNVDPGTLEGVPLLPNAVDQSLEAFLAEPILTDGFGPELVDAITTVRKGEAALFAGSTPEDVTERSRWRY